MRKLFSTLILVAAAAGCSSSDHAATGKPCERCTRGYVPVRDGDRRAVCISHDKVMNCEKIPAECPDCARIQRKDMDHPAD
jgi:hypothetical protein